MLKTLQKIHLVIKSSPLNIEQNNFKASEVILVKAKNNFL